MIYSPLPDFEETAAKAASDRLNLVQLSGHECDLDHFGREAAEPVGETRRRAAERVRRTVASSFVCRGDGHGRASRP